MVLIMSDKNGTGVSVAKGLEKLGIGSVICDGNNIPESIADFSAMFFTGEFAVSSENAPDMLKKLCADCAASEVPSVFDPTVSVIRDDHNALLNELAGCCEIFVPSDEDAKILCGLDDPEKVAEHYLEKGTQKIVVTLDKRGAYFRSAKEKGYTPTFRADKVVDVNGAGNAFAAGLLCGVIEEIPLAEAVVRANACGSISIQVQGDYFPDTAELREYMLDHPFKTYDVPEEGSPLKNDFAGEDM